MAASSLNVCAIFHVVSPSACPSATCGARVRRLWRQRGVIVACTRTPRVCRRRKKQPAPVVLRGAGVLDARSCGRHGGTTSVLAWDVHIIQHSRSSSRTTVSVTPFSGCGSIRAVLTRQLNSTARCCLRHLCLLGLCLFAWALVRGRVALPPLLCSPINILRMRFPAMYLYSFCYSNSDDLTRRRTLAAFAVTFMVLFAMPSPPYPYRKDGLVTGWATWRLQRACLAYRRKQASWRTWRVPTGRGIALVALLRLSLPVNSFMGCALHFVLVATPLWRVGSGGAGRSARPAAHARRIPSAGGMNQAGRRVAGGDYSRWDVPAQAQWTWRGSFSCLFSQRRSFTVKGSTSAFAPAAAGLRRLLLLYSSPAGLPCYLALVAWCNGTTTPSTANTVLAASLRFALVWRTVLVSGRVAERVADAPRRLFAVYLLPLCRV